MIDHKAPCLGNPCTCGQTAWEDTAWATSNPTIGLRVACNCIHVDGVWMTRHSEPCFVHPCIVCTMRGGKHIAHMHIEGLSTMAEEVEVRHCWACGKQQYRDRQGQWTHVYPAQGCEREEARQ